MGAEVEAIRVRVDAFAERVGGQAVHVAEEVEVLGGGQLGVEGDVLWHDADQRADAGAIVSHVEAAEMHCAAVEGQEAGEDGERRCLACAIGSEQPEELALGDVQRESVDRGCSGAAIRLAEVADVDGGCHLWAFTTRSRSVKSARSMPPMAFRSVPSVR